MINLAGFTLNNFKSCCTLRSIIFFYYYNDIDRAKMISILKTIILNCIYYIYMIWHCQYLFSKRPPCEIKEARNSALLGLRACRCNYYLQLHSAAFLLHLAHKPFFIGAPHFLQGVQPHDWHMPYHPPSL